MSQPAAVRLAIQEEMTIYQAPTQKERLLEALIATEHLEIDLSAVTGMDSAGLQLLILLKREAQAREKKLTIVAHSAVVQQILDFCNLAGSFGDPVVITASH
ncbi:MAG TPA: STAS domain-containing protein [Accumulibacter sp.]|nr:STAS domain-containing protein [Accumulibacter sp.]HMW17936.1 STAS domain-containing protein [Accumulibacter sp.]HMX21766.1 STAS domain-containing protein [Accumulibacter sp.]HMY06275.1 STAS domain-containing protein [Accumulibacter sp.]HNC18269.1 STAS domain-containing protein [Accumulibacter sp.]